MKSALGFGTFASATEASATSPLPLDEASDDIGESDGGDFIGEDVGASGEPFGGSLGCPDVEDGSDAQAEKGNAGSAEANVHKNRYCMGVSFLGSIVDRHE